jgi:hypothetical protein
MRAASMASPTRPPDAPLIIKLRDSDKPFLTRIRQLTQGDPNRFQITTDLRVLDSLLAAQQLEAVFRAEDKMHDPAQGKIDSEKACSLNPGQNWCGGFVAASYGPLL